MSLEEKLKATEEKLFEAAEREAVEREVAFREATIEEPKLEPVKEFQSEELNNSLDKSYKDGNDKDVEEIFFTIW